MDGIWQEAGGRWSGAMMMLCGRRTTWLRDVTQACKRFVDDGACVSHCPPLTVYSTATHTMRDNPHGKYMFGRRCVKECPREYRPQYPLSRRPQCRRNQFIRTVIKTTRLSVREAVSVTGWRCTENGPELKTVNK